LANIISGGNINMIPIDKTKLEKLLLHISIFIKAKVKLISH